MLKLPYPSPLECAPTAKVGARWCAAAHPVVDVELWWRAQPLLDDGVVAADGALARVGRGQLEAVRQQPDHGLWVVPICGTDRSDSLSIR